MKIIIKNREETDRLVCEAVSDFVNNKPDAVLSFAAGNTYDGIYKLIAESDTDFSNTEVFNICDYLGLNDETQSLNRKLDERLYSRIGITNIHSPNGESDKCAAEYDAEIAEAGGIDLMLLGIGLNGHIGFNEPATLYDTHTHIARLTDSTKRMKASDFDGSENVPDFGVTMGLKTICGAKNVFLVAYGEEKADIIHKLVYGKTSTYVPAAMLQMHMNLTLYLDEAAASKLD